MYSFPLFYGIFIKYNSNNTLMMTLLRILVSDVQSDISIKLSI